MTLAEDNATLCPCRLSSPNLLAMLSHHVVPVARELGIATGLVTVVAAITTSKL